MPAYYEGPGEMQMSHLIGRPRISVAFGAVIPTLGVNIERRVATELTDRLQAAIEGLGCQPSVKSIVAVNPGPFAGL